MLTVEVIVDRPMPAWQVPLLTRLASVDGLALEVTARAPAVPAAVSLAWRLVVARCSALAPADAPPATDAGHPPRRGAVVVDLTAAGDLSGAWSLRDQFGRPLAAAFPFCRAGGLDEVAEVRLLDGRGEVAAVACLSSKGGLDAVLERAFGWGARLLEGDLRRLAAGMPRLEAALSAPAPGPAGEPVGWRIVATDALGRVARRIGDWTVDETWMIGVVDRPIASFLDDPVARGVRWVRAPRGSYYADPFGLPDEPTVLCERLDHETGVGRLVTVPLDGGGEGASPSDGERPFELGIRGHASFPFLATDGEGRTLCVPEAEATRRLTIWRPDADGDRGWRQLAVAAEGVRAIDPALFAWEGRWWLAYTDGELGASDNLCLLHAAGPEGPWLPHAGNPVKVDVRSSRSAGTPFVRQGRLYRPAQDCAAGYGAGVVINRVTRLTPDAFAEEPATRVAPDPDGRRPDGLHTLSSWGERTLIDAKVHGLVPAALRRRVARRAATLARRLRRADPTTRTAEAET